MKLQQWMVRTGCLALICALLGGASLMARELFKDTELRGELVKVQFGQRSFKLKRDGAHSIKKLYWNSRTVFRFPERLASWKDMRTNVQVRVYFTKDVFISSGCYKDIVNKVVIHPTSDPDSPEYNK
jgi:hypothetical protein